MLEEYNYEMPKINFEKIKFIIDEALKSFPILEKEESFNEITFKIIIFLYIQFIIVFYAIVMI